MQYYNMCQYFHIFTVCLVQGGGRMHNFVYRVFLKNSNHTVFVCLFRQKNHNFDTNDLPYGCQMNTKASIPFCHICLLCTNPYHNCLLCSRIPKQGMFKVRLFHGKTLMVKRTQATVTNKNAYILCADVNYNSIS